MENSIFRSISLGIGQLISQKKRFEVPLYQRSYSWGPSEVEQFIDDILRAIDENYPNYFLGSILLTEPENGIWGILDGQQRLSTASMIYSSIRHLLTEKNQLSDADQILNEFLAVRALGGENSPRLLLNAENRSVFLDVVVHQNSDSTIKALKEKHNKNKSNLLIIQASTQCRRRIDDWIGKDREAAIKKLYKISDYLEKKTLVVVIEVSNESDAYIAFETLNTRGQDLSALDLVKNYIFSSLKSQHEEIRILWSKMKDNIGEKEADDFLRIFWMGNYGLIQKSRLYFNLKKKFNSEPQVFDLLKNLASGSKIYAAIDDSKNDFWQDYSGLTRHLIEVLKILNSKQTRPIIFACSNAVNLNSTLMDQLLWYLVVLTIRFQTVGKGRQGVLEKQCAKIALEISNTKQIDISIIKSEIEKIIPTDDEFKSEFIKYQEVSLKRALYILSTIEYCNLHDFQYEKSWKEIDKALDSSSDISVSNILPKNLDSSWDIFTDEENIDTSSITSNISNFILVSKSGNIKNGNKEFNVLKERLKNSDFWTTKQVTEYDSWDVFAFAKRQEILRNIAVKIWKLN